MKNLHAWTLAVVLIGSSLARGQQCERLTVFEERFDSAVEPAGWAFNGWHLTTDCTSSCMSTYHASISNFPNCLVNALAASELRSPVISLPPNVAGGDTLTINFCFVTFRENWWLDQLRVQSGGQTVLTFSLMNHPAGTQPPYDLSSLAGQDIELVWYFAGQDIHHQKGTIHIDNVEIFHIIGSGGDCNENRVPDDCDLLAGIDTDCNANGVPDGCEDDCNENGVADDCEGIPDCNSNGIFDTCDLQAGTSTDCNGNGILDECEPGDDCNSNGVPDFCESAGDCNANGVLDSCDIDTGGSHDNNGDGVPDECQSVGNAFCFGDGSGATCPCGNLSPNPGDGCLHSGGVGMRIRALSFASISNDNWVIETTQVPTGPGGTGGNTGLFFAGKSQLGFWQFDGLQCAGGDARRFRPQFVTGGTVADTGFVAQDPSGTYFVVGETVNFQYWSRDAATGSSPCGTGANFSPGLAMLIYP